MKELSAKMKPSEQNIAAVWLPLIFGLAVVCAESTRTMGAWHTQIWLSQVLSLFGSNDASGAYELNHVLRKTSHFLGYGVLGVLFTRVWLPTLLQFMRGSWLSPRLHAIGYAVLCTCSVASLDEIHQSFLPGRTSSLLDVVIDTSGATLLSFIFLAVLWIRRQAAVRSA